MQLNGLQLDLNAGLLPSSLSVCVALSLCRSGISRSVYRLLHLYSLGEARLGSRQPFLTSPRHI